VTIEKTATGSPVLQAVGRVRRFVTGSPEERVRAFYEMVDRQMSGGSDYRPVLGITRPYVNLGWWEPGVTEHDDASEALADQLAEAAGLGPGDEVLDVGFGYGEQDVRWLETCRPARIAGHSWGGYIGLRLAAEHPDLVAALALLDGGWLDPSTAFSSWEQYAGLLTAAEPEPLAPQRVRDLLRLLHPDWSLAAVDDSLASMAEVDGMLVPRPGWPPTCSTC
jgi:pimeloyl-ACP methyl ester carboxylesterase